MLESKPKSSGGEEIICFDKNEFMKENFSVDEFLHKNRRAPSLELLRDNLGIYLKGLRASMIDLINEDYADFVNLSANLVGLDQSIEAIQRPLGQFRLEIESIETLIKENENAVRSELEKKRQLRELKRSVMSLKKVQEINKKLEDLVANRLSKKLQAADLERAALELIQLKFNGKFCTSYLNEEQKQKISKLEQVIHEKLRELFILSLEETKSNCTDKLERCLRIYITLDDCHLAEQAFRKDVVGPYMTTIISEHSLQNSPQGLGGIYGKILNFISLHMTDLLRLTQYTDKLSGFNFLVNSFWADVEMRLETHMTSIFAPGNSEVFYSKYKCTREFLTKIEELLAAEEAVKAFRQNQQLKSFHTRWNLPVYFQICFQEIAGQFESALEPVLRNDILETESTEISPHNYQVKTFNNAEKALKRCWSEGIYLPELFPKFYKLNVQIISRLSRWINDLLHALNETIPNDIKLDKTQILVALHQDIQKLVGHLPKLQDEVLSKIPQNRLQSPLVGNTLANSFADLEEMLSEHLNALQRALVEMLISESILENLRQVNDLPRLYRKTNREVPTRCSSYVEQMLRPLKSFYTEQNNKLGSENVKKILLDVCSTITSDYYNNVTDVLTSVQKTEESLRRLRNLKSGSSQMSSSMTNSSSSTGFMTDDDKIRLQLRVDVVNWTAELAKMSFMINEITKLHELNSLVEESVKMKEINL